MGQLKVVDCTEHGRQVALLVFEDVSGQLLHDERQVEQQSRVPW